METSRFILVATSLKKRLFSPRTTAPVWSSKCAVQHGIVVTGTGRGPVAASDSIITYDLRECHGLALDAARLLGCCLF